MDQHEQKRQSINYLNPLLENTLDQAHAFIFTNIFFKKLGFIISIRLK